MPRTHEELEQAARNAEEWLDSLDPEATQADDTADLRRIGLALGDVAGAQTRLREAVETARTNGWSWARIAMVLGIARQSAREQFGQPAPH